jgi:hypothetical protein
MIDMQVDRLVALMLEFHVKTGADIELLKEFTEQVCRITTESAIKIAKEEITRAFQEVK